ncbi:MAG TPA: phosphopantetheine-binding protein [Caulobacteraceae bacterium]
MADGSIVSTRDQISHLVGGLLAKRKVTISPEASADLRKSGLTSLDMVNLMLAIEAEFDIEIPQSEMTPVNFRSISAIEAVVRRLAQR